MLRVGAESEPERGVDGCRGIGRFIAVEQLHGVAGDVEPVADRVAQIGKVGCAQEAEHVLDEGAVPIYLHSPTNEASARTADASGFPDRGWKILGIFPSDPGA